jgi:hypothetical protein
VRVVNLRRGRSTSNSIEQSQKGLSLELNYDIVHHDDVITYDCGDNDVIRMITMRIAAMIHTLELRRMLI